MRRRTSPCGLPAALALASAAAVAPAVANAQDIAIPWFTIDGGGTLLATGGGLELAGSIGQPDAGPVMAAGAFTLDGGFWPGSTAGGAPDCPEDLDGDGEIGLEDLSILLGNFGSPGGPDEGDIDGDGQIGLEDLSRLLAQFGSACI